MSTVQRYVGAQDCTMLVEGNFGYSYQAVLHVDPVLFGVAFKGLFLFNELHDVLVVWVELWQHAL